MGGRGSGGKNKTPTEIKLAQGNPGHREILEHEATPEAGDPEMPEYLNEEERAAWVRVVGVIRKNSVMTKVDGIAIAALCSSLVLFEWMNARVQAADSRVLALADPDGLDDFAKMVRIRGSALKELRSSWQEFGLSPSSRTGLPTAKGETKASAIEKILRSKGKSDEVVN